MIEHANRDRRFLEKNCFTDESCFTLTHAPNFQNSRVWAQENPNLLSQPHTQYQQKTNVWVGILGHHIIGPFFYQENLTTEKFLDMLVNEIGPKIMEVAGDREIFFQMDGCPAHNSRIVQDFLKEAFPGRIISTHGDIAWAARSPDLSPNDFFLWGYLKTVLYHRGKTYENVESLQAAIRQACDAITGRQLCNVRKELEDRFGYCVAAGGDIFEHLI